jgi:hypothetical protein
MGVGLRAMTVWKGLGVVFIHSLIRLEQTGAGWVKRVWRSGGKIKKSGTRLPVSARSIAWRVCRSCSFGPQF